MMNKSYFEPWRVADPKPTPAAEAARDLPCPPEADPGAWARLGTGKPDYVLVWGTGMMPEDQSPSFTTRTAFGGEVMVPIPGDRIVLTVRPPVNDRGLKARDLAERIAACVNAMEGVADPVQWVRWARSQLERQGAA